MDLNIPQAPAEQPKRANGAAAHSTLVKTGVCHCCQQPTVVFSCYKDYAFTSCSSVPDRKTFCAGCCERFGSAKFPQAFESLSSWQCPARRRTCPCEACKAANMEEAERKHELKAIVLTRGADIVQSILDYNAQLIANLSQRRAAMTQHEIDTSMQILFENLKSLSIVVRARQVSNNQKQGNS